MAEYSKSFEKLENSSVGLALTFPAATIDGAYRAALEKYSKQLALKGFRRGKAPVSLVESKYGETILGEAFTDLLDGAVKEMFSSDDESKRVAAEYMPLDLGGLSLSNEDEIFPLAKGKDVVCRFRYDVYPQFELGARKGLKVEYHCDDYDPKVEDKRLEEIRQRMSVVVEKKEGAAEAGDIATVDIAELDEDGNEVEGTKKTDYVCSLRAAGADPDGIEDQIIGMKAGEEKTARIEHGANSRHAGKTKRWRLAVKKLRVRDVPELDDDFAQDADEKYKTLEDMKEDIHKTLFAEYEEGRDLSKVAAVLDKIAGESGIEVPETMLRNAVYEKWVEFVYQMGGGGSRTSFEEMEKKLAGMGLTFDGYASSLLEGEGRAGLLGVVRRSLVLAKLVSDENLAGTTDDDLRRHIQEKELDIDPDSPDFEKEKDNLKDQVVNERARRFLLENNEFVLTAPPAAPAAPAEKPASANEPAPAEPAAPAEKPAPGEEPVSAAPAAPQADQSAPAESAESAEEPAPAEPAAPAEKPAPGEEPVSAEPAPQAADAGGKAQ